MREILELRYQSVSVFFPSRFFWVFLHLQVYIWRKDRTCAGHFWDYPKEKHFSLFWRNSATIWSDLSVLFSETVCSEMWRGSQMKMSLKLPQQIALAKYSTQVSAIVRVMNVTQFCCRSFVSSSLSLGSAAYYIPKDVAQVSKSVF